MTNEEQKEVAFRVEEDGFDYAFRNYSDFAEIKDERFHELRKAYIQAAQELEAYVGPYEVEDEEPEIDPDEWRKENPD